MPTKRRPRLFTLAADDQRTYEEFGRLLSPALKNLPDHVREWARKNVIFVPLVRDSPTWWLSVGWWKRKRGIIFLTDGFKTAPEALRAFMVAHEIAHAYLKHETLDITNVPEAEEKRHQEQANELAKKWLSNE